MSDFPKVGEQRNKVLHPTLYVASALGLICSGKSVNVVLLRVDEFVNAVKSNAKDLAFEILPDSEA